MGIPSGYYMNYYMSDSLNSSTPSNSPNTPNTLNTLNTSKVSGCPGYYMNTIIPQTLRTLLISPYTSYSPIIPNNSNELNRVKHFEPLGLSSSLKEIDFNALQCVER